MIIMARVDDVSPCRRAKILARYGNTLLDEAIYILEMPTLLRRREKEQVLAPYRAWMYNTSAKKRKRSNYRSLVELTNQLESLLHPQYTICTALRATFRPTAIYLVSVGKRAVLFLEHGYRSLAGVA